MQNNKEHMLKSVAKTVRPEESFFPFSPEEKCFEETFYLEGRDVNATLLHLLLSTNWKKLVSKDCLTYSKVILRTDNQ